jgi:hypothetical protein
VNAVLGTIHRPSFDHGWFAERDIGESGLVTVIETARRVEQRLVGNGFWQGR